MADVYSVKSPSDDKSVLIRVMYWCRQAFNRFSYMDQL